MSITAPVHIQQNLQQHQQFEQPKKIESQYDLYWKSGILGAFRGFCGLPFEHPFDVLKTRLQATASIPKKYQNTPQYHQLQNSSMIQNWAQMYKQLGLRKGIYAGYFPSLFRVMSKQFYRFPMMMYFPNQFKQLYSTKFQKKYDGIHKVSAGLLIASIETVIICPLERLKVFLMTKEQKSNNFQNNKGLLRSLYTGINALYYRQMISWVSFLYLDYKCKKIAKEFRGIKMNEALSDLDLILCSAFIGVANVLVVQPFDKIKTVYQMNGNEKYYSLSFVQNLKRVFRKEGIKGLYSGLQPRLCHYVINSIFTCSILEQLELTMNKKLDNKF